MIRLLLVYSAVFFKTLAFQYSNKNCFNVGTVLFTTEDLQKDWSQDSIDLLRARRHFQGLLEPLTQFSSSVDDRNLKSLFDYFKDSYNFINSESRDSVTGSILTAALSDVLGGYLKCWVLPVTKYAYYGGMVSPENTQKVLKLYDDIKEYLETDGSRWHNADSKALSSVVIDVVPVQRYRSRSIVEPCKRLAYFEKTQEGLSIPTPSINWDSNSRTVFLPLKEESLVSLCSATAFTVLTNYYDISRGCINSMTPERTEEFEDKFQAWLRDEIVPHLNDDGIYIGLGGILSLIDFQTPKAPQMDYNTSTVLSKLCACGISGRQLRYMVIFLGLIWMAVLFLKISNIGKQKETEGSNAALKDSIMQSAVTTGFSTAVEYVHEAERRISTVYKKEDQRGSRILNTKSETKTRGSKHNKSISQGDSMHRSSIVLKCTEERSSMTDQKSSNHQFNLENKSSKPARSSECCKLCNSNNTVTLVKSTPECSKHTYTPHRMLSSSSVASEMLISTDSFCNLHRESKTKNTCLFCIKEVDVCSSGKSNVILEKRSSKGSMVKDVNSVLTIDTLKDSESNRSQQKEQQQQSVLFVQTSENVRRPLPKHRPSRIPMKLSAPCTSPGKMRSSSPVPAQMRVPPKPPVKAQRTYTIMMMRNTAKPSGITRPAPKYSKVPRLVRGTVDDSIIKKKSLESTSKLNITL